MCWYFNQFRQSLLDEFGWNSALWKPKALPLKKVLNLYKMHVLQCTQPPPKASLWSLQLPLYNYSCGRSRLSRSPPCQRPSQAACLELMRLSSAFLRDKPSVWTLVLSLWWITHTIGCSFLCQCKLLLSFHNQNSQFWCTEQANLWTLFLWQAGFSTWDLSLSSQGNY